MLLLPVAAAGAAAAAARAGRADAAAPLAVGHLLVAPATATAMPDAAPLVTARHQHGVAAEAGQAGREDGQSRPAEAAAAAGAAAVVLGRAGARVAVVAVLVAEAVVAEGLGGGVAGYPFETAEPGVGRFRAVAAAVVIRAESAGAVGASHFDYPLALPPGPAVAVVAGEELGRATGTECAAAEGLRRACGGEL